MFHTERILFCQSVFILCQPDKFQRIEAISPLWEHGHVYYNVRMKNDPDMRTGIDQTLSCERGMSGHDDGPDADEGAIFILQGLTRQQRFKPSVGRRKAPKNSW